MNGEIILTLSRKTMVTLKIIDRKPKKRMHSKYKVIVYKIESAKIVYRTTAILFQQKRPMSTRSTKFFQILLKLIAQSS